MDDLSNLSHVEGSVATEMDHLSSLDTMLKSCDEALDALGRPLKRVNPEEKASEEERARMEQEKARAKQRAYDAISTASDSDEEEDEEEEEGINPGSQGLHVLIAVGGIISSDDGNEDPHGHVWKTVLAKEFRQSFAECYYVAWDPEPLVKFGAQIAEGITASTVFMGGTWIAMVKWKVLLTAYTTIMWPYWIMAASEMIDTSFAIAVDRANKCSLLLAECLTTNLHGKRPVSLVATGVGCIAVLRVLRELSRQGRLDIVENVYFFGATMPIRSEEWKEAMECVAGEFVNAYSKNDWFLGFVFRTRTFKSIAGLSAVNLPDVRNVDCSALVENHLDWRNKLQTIMDMVLPR